MPLAPGTRLGPYEILAPIGAGGMGEVYRATDTRLGRIVAVKVLASEFSERFEIEARAISAVNHPNICALYDIGTHEGRSYLVLEYVEGKPLHGPLRADEALRVAVQIAAAIEAAHRKGITHRDLKPANIMVAEDGSVKLLDFGLAKLAGNGSTDVTRTLAGTVIGTAAYMAPEQAEGRPLDARSDVFSFGAVIYELITGRRAFPGESMASVLSSVLRDDPMPLGSVAPPGLEPILMRCLRKNAGERFQEMRDVRAALEALRSPTQAVPVQPARAEASIAVLPFANLSADKENEYFSDGLAEEIINALTRVRGLKVTARTSAFAFRGENQDIRKIAETLNVRTILEGSVRRAGSRIRVTAQLINAADGYHLWSERYDAEMADVFAVQDEIASAIAAALKLKLSGELAEMRRHTPTLPAFEALLKGRHYQFDGTPEGLKRSKEFFDTAIALDPEYALAHAALASYFWSLAFNGLEPARDVMGFARAEALTALDLDPSLPEALAALGVGTAAYDYDWKESERWFKRAMSGDSVTAGARWCYAFYYLMPYGRLDESVKQLERVVEEDPLNLGMRIALINALHAAGQDDRALTEADKALAMDKNRWNVYLALGRIHAFRGRLAEALVAAEKAYQLAAWNVRVIAIFAGVLFQSGNRSRAIELVEKLKAESGGAYGTPMALAVFHAMCGETDAAAGWFEKAIEQRDPSVVGYLRTPLMKILRSSPQWPALAKQMNLPEVA
ncbi:MAG TPA: protein kinase [Bryobacteraceae bacterium]|nr:protein kinase [Bryobacteraceae bacterium]